MVQFATANGTSGLAFRGADGGSVPGQIDQAVAPVWTGDRPADSIRADVREGLFIAGGRPRPVLPHDLRRCAPAAPRRRCVADRQRAAHPARFLHVRSVLLQRTLSPDARPCVRSTRGRAGALGLSARQRPGARGVRRLSRFFRPSAPLGEFRSIAPALDLIISTRQYTCRTRRALLCLRRRLLGPSVVTPNPRPL